MPLQDANPTPSFGGFGLSDAQGNCSSHFWAEYVVKQRDPDQLRDSVVHPPAFRHDWHMLEERRNETLALLPVVPKNAPFVS